MWGFLFVLMLTVSVISWVSARISIVYAIYATNSAEAMLERMIFETKITLLVVLVLGLMGYINWMITLFFIARSTFLLMADWDSIADNFHSIKRMF